MATLDGPLRRLRLRPALLESLRGYRLADFSHDLSAGLVVGAVAIPLAIAFAIASGASPTNGLVTVVIAGSIAALLGGSRFLVTGPTGAFVVVLAGIVSKFEALHPGQGLVYLFVATFVGGALLVLAGVFRLGAVIKFIPYPVTTGFTAGIAVVIFAGQLPDLFGVSLSHPPAEPLLKAWEVIEGLARGLANPAALAIAAGTVVIIQGIKKYAPRVPGPIVALIAFTAFVYYADTTFANVHVVTVGEKFTIPTGVPAPHLPPLSFDVIREVFPSAITIALLGAIESLLAAVVADGMTGKRHDSNQELIGQGVANMASPLFGGIAATGAIARTATSIQNGARTPVASLIHVVLVLCVLLFMAPLAGLIPMAALAGILVVVAWNMSERHHFRKILKMPRTDAGVMLATFVLTIAVDLTVAVMVGLLLATGIFLHRMSAMTRVGAVDPLSDTTHTEHRFKPEEVPPGVIVYSIDGPFFFGAADQFSATMASVADPPRVVVLRMRDVPYLDATGLNALESAVKTLQRRGTRVMVSAIQSQPLDMMLRSGAVGIIGDGNLFRDTSSALAAARPPIASAPNA